MNRLALVALAVACGVLVTWLMLAGRPAPQREPPRATPQPGQQQQGAATPGVRKPKSPSERRQSVDQPRPATDPAAPGAQPSASAGGARLRVRVLDPDGAGRTGARLVVAPSGLPDPPPTDVTGRTELHLPVDATARVHAWADGYVRSLSALVSGEAGDRDGELVLRLRRGARVTGQLLDAAGRPRPSVEVAIFSADPEGWMEETETGADGEFTFEAVPAGRRILAADGPSFPRRQDEPPAPTARVDVVEGGEHHVVLGGPASSPVAVRGRVLRDGQPLAGCEVIALPDGPGLLVTGIEVRTDARGEFGFELERPGRLVLGLLLGRMPHVFRVDVPPTGRSDLELRLESLRIEGRVEDVHGAPVADARVHACREGGFSFLDLELDPIQARSGADGRFLLADLAPGNWALQARSPTASSPLLPGLRLDETQPVGEVILQVVGGGRLRGVVHDELGQPVNGARVLLRDATGRWCPHQAESSSTDDGRNGIYVLEGPPPGRFTVQARTELMASAESAPLEVAPGQEAVVDLRLVSATTLEVVLVDRGGAPAGVASLRVLDAAGRLQSGVLLHGEYDRILREGFSAFAPRVGQLVPGSYRVLARAEDGRGASAEVIVSGEPLQRVELALH